MEIQRPLLFATDDVGSQIELVTIPAEPGWSTLSAGADASGVAGERIIAWSIQNRAFVRRGARHHERIIESDVMPITVSGSKPGCAVRDPDGRIFAGGAYQSESDFLAALGNAEAAGIAHG